ncbi:unnamed protein product [Pylaiella littoralis]
MTETSGVLPHLYLSSKKISPVEVELPPTGIAPNTVCVSSTEGTAGRQDPVEAPSHEESGERSAELEGLGAAGLLARGGAEDVASQVAGALPAAIEPPNFGGSSGTEGGSDKHQLPEGQQDSGSGFSRGYSVASSTPSTSGASSRDLGERDYGHQLQVAVTPDGRAMTGKCLTYQDGRGGTLATDFFVDDLHYSSANPNYHRNMRRHGICGGGCTVT